MNKPWVALLGWFPPVYVVGLFANKDKYWVQDTWLGWMGGNTPIFWWPTRLYQERKRQTGGI